MKDAWDRLHWLFDVDDGALDEIGLTGLGESGVAGAYDFIRARAQEICGDVFWHVGLDREERLSDHPAAARLVAQHQAEPYHILAKGLRFCGTMIPDLGVFVFPGELRLDYRKGPEWGRPQLFALFELLRQVVAVSAGHIRLGRPEGSKTEQQFLWEWEGYCAAVR